MQSFAREPQSLIAPLHYSKKTGVEFIDTQVAARSGGLSQCPIKFLTRLQKAIYPVCSCHNMDFCTLDEKQESELYEVL